MQINSTEFTPISDRVLVAPIELDKGELTTTGGIVLETEQNQSIIDRPNRGAVIAIGTDVESVAVGQVIMWLETDGQDIVLDDGHFLVLREQSILGYKNG